MRHGKKKSPAQTAHRKSMLANMACSLIEHKRINTTVAKAKALKQFVEPLITKSKAIRLTIVVLCLLIVKYAVTDLFRDVAAKWRPSRWISYIKEIVER
jgi:large subunit ribosomal protein L17